MCLDFCVSFSSFTMLSLFSETLPLLQHTADSLVHLTRGDSELSVLEGDTVQLPSVYLLHRYLELQLLKRDQTHQCSHCPHVSSTEENHNAVAETDGQQNHECNGKSFPEQHNLIHERLSSDQHSADCYYNANSGVYFNNTFLSYQKLNSLANMVARRLRDKLHVSTDRCVIAIDIDPGFSLIIAILAVLKLGAAYLPLDSDTAINRVGTSMGTDLKDWF